jgi:hypothetical protein
MKKLLLCALVCTSSHALEVSYGMGEHTFSNDKEKRQACVIAENKAIENSIFNYGKRQFDSVQENFCVDTKEHTYCNYVKDIIFYSSGKVNSVVDTIKRSDKDTCYVEVKTEIEPHRQLNAYVKSKRSYLVGDKLTAEIKVGEPLYLYIFNLHKKGVDLIFPNEYNNEALVDDRFELPNANIIASLDKKDSLSNETLLFLFTKRRQDIDYRDVNKNNFKELVNSIPVQERKLVQHNFIIKRSER